MLVKGATGGQEVSASQMYFDLETLDMFFAQFHTVTENECLASKGHF